MRRIIILTAMLGLGSPLAAQEDPLQHLERSTLIARKLFPPDLILECQKELQLESSQLANLADAYRRLQSGETADLQLQLLEKTLVLDSLLSQALVDREAAFEQVDRVLETEREVKRLHLGTLIEIKNMLTPEQQDFLTGILEKENRVGEIQMTESRVFLVLPSRRRGCGGGG
jgi:Spy/CpxP family protein refolding chaperone